MLAHAAPHCVCYGECHGVHTYEGVQTSLRTLHTPIAARDLLCCNRSQRSALLRNNTVFSAMAEQTVVAEAAKVSVPLDELRQLVLDCVTTQGHSQEESEIITKVLGLFSQILAALKA